MAAQKKVFGWLVCLLIRWLPSLLFGWYRKLIKLVGCLVGWFVVVLVCYWVSKLVGWLVGWICYKSLIWSVDRSIGQLLIW